MYKKYMVKKKGGKMLAVKKDMSITANKSDVIKAIVKSNKKHATMMRKLAK